MNCEPNNQALLWSCTLNEALITRVTTAWHLYFIETNRMSISWLLLQYNIGHSIFP